MFACFSQMFLQSIVCSQTFVKTGNIQMYFILGLVVANHFPTIILKKQWHHWCFTIMQIHERGSTAIPFLCCENRSGWSRFGYQVGPGEQPDYTALTNCIVSYYICDTGSEDSTFGASSMFEKYYHHSGIKLLGIQVPQLTVKCNFMHPLFPTSISYKLFHGEFLAIYTSVY